MPIPLSIYPELADYYYENHEYASALFYYESLSKAGYSKYHARAEELRALNEKSHG